MAVSLSFDTTSTRNWTSRSTLFQMTTPPPLESDQYVTVQAQTFIHTNGSRNALDVIGGKPSFPIGAHVRVLSVPTQISREKNAINAGLFWQGRNQSFTGLIGLSYLQEGLSHFDGSRFIIPSMTIRTLHARKRIQSSQYFSVPISFNATTPDRLHTSHHVGTLFPIGKRFFITAGVQADMYLLFAKESANMLFNSNFGFEKEVLQFLIGPAFAIIHPSYGELSLKIVGAALLSTDADSGKKNHLRVMNLPSFSIAYHLAF